MDRDAWTTRGWRCRGGATRESRRAGTPAGILAARKCCSDENPFSFVRPHVAEPAQRGKGFPEGWVREGILAPVPMLPWATPFCMKIGKLPPIFSTARSKLREPRRAGIARARFGGGKSIQRESDRMNRMNRMNKINGMNRMDKIYNPGAPGPAMRGARTPMESGRQRGFPHQFSSRSWDQGEHSLH